MRGVRKLDPASAASTGKRLPFYAFVKTALTKINYPQIRDNMTGLG